MARRKARKLLYIALLASTLLVDMGTKVLLAPHLEPIYNPGIALSILASQPWAPYALFALNLVVGIALFTGVLHLQTPANPDTPPKSKALSWLFNASRGKVTWVCIGATLIASGALGNALGRAVNLLQGLAPYVTDFIRYPGLFTGNFADICITAGALVLVGASFKR